VETLLHILTIIYESIRISQTNLNVLLRNIILKKNKLNLKVKFPHLNGVAINLRDLRFAVRQDNKVYTSF
jgi:poly(3-hydroxyalkanoate) synthetase